MLGHRRLGQIEAARGGADRPLAIDLDEGAQAL
jgi:hypothetical protein